MTLDYRHRYIREYVNVLLTTRLLTSNMEDYGNFLWKDGWNSRCTCGLCVPSGHFVSSLRSDLPRSDGKGFAGKPLKFQMVIIRSFLCDKLFQKMFE